MTKRVRRKIPALVLTAAMVLSMLPSSLFGALRVEAAESESAANVTYSQGEWTKSPDQEDYEYRETSWDFTTAGLTDSVKIAAGDTVKGIVSVAGKVQLKKATEGLSIQTDSVIAIPLDTKTDKIDISFSLSSSNGTRYLILGDTVNQKVYHKSSNAAKTNADGALSNKAFTGTYDSTYFTGNTFYISSATNADSPSSDSGESKIATLTVKEYRAIESSGGSETGSESGSETGSETGTETGSDTESGTGTETGTGSESETGTGSEGETGSESESSANLRLVELNLTEGLTAGTAYDGGISVLENMTYKPVSGDIIGGVTYQGYVAGSQNPKTDGAKSEGNVPNSGAALILNAEHDGKLTVAMKINSGKTIYFVDATANIFEEYKNSGTSSEFASKSYKVLEGHTYYLYGGGTKIPIYAISVDYRGPEAWDAIAAPVLGEPTVDAKAGTITVPYTAQVGGRYADSIEISMISNGKTIDTETMTAEGENGSAVFTPSASGSYSFVATLKRTDCEGKQSNETKAVDFVLPMAKPTIVGAENQGNAVVRFSWKAVPEADSYKVYVNGEMAAENITKLAYRFDNLNADTEYTFAVSAVRGDDADISEKAEITLTTTNEAKKEWYYAAFGSSTNKNNNGYTVNDDGTIGLHSTGGKGKLVPASTDGVAFYYTTIDPENENFSLSADITVNSWTLSNGQEGFGIMAADAVGTDGDSSTFWNNSYMGSVTKVEYYWDADNQTVTDSSAYPKYTMKLGIGSQEKIGVTKANIADGTSSKALQSTMTTLETSAPLSGKYSGTYNVVGNHTNSADTLGNLDTKTTFHFEICRNNTGYSVSYTDEAGNTTTKQYYHGDDGDELTKIDENNIYVGFFTARNADITISNINIKTVSPENDEPKQERPVSLVTPNYTIESSETANSEDYDMVYYGNADGKLTIKDFEGNLVAENTEIKAKTKYHINTKLSEGDNTFKIEFTPDADYKPSKYEKLSSYDSVSFDFTVSLNVKDLKNIYISPDGSASGTGEKDSPLDIYTAVKYAAPGQTLILTEGTYKLESTVVVKRGIDGTADEKINMIADPEAKTRPVLDFQGKCAGMVLAGDYWYFNGFDVTNSQNAMKGIQVSGSNNTLEDVKAYRNGNTGIQISRYLGTDKWEDWPANNLILNCTSYLNADAGYEDADGFAAKLTIADGNVFDGCIAAYNADDGWDLFAKVETGPIGKVEIRNCVAFKNGYVIDEDGKEVDAGNGNGFKMGGSSITGYHVLKNSIAFGNKAKGFDSNSCPDIQIYNSTSYNNESYNVALYTNDAKNTDFYAEGIISYKNANTVSENIKLKGTQDSTKVYGSTNYFFNGEESVNTVTDGTVTSVNENWFVSTDMEKAVNGGITRNSDGSINMGGFLELTSLAPSDAGARFEGQTMTDESSDKGNTESSSGSDDTNASQSSQSGTTVTETAATETTANVAASVSIGKRASGVTSVEESVSIADTKKTETEATVKEETVKTPEAEKETVTDETSSKDTVNIETGEAPLDAGTIENSKTSNLWIWITLAGCVAVGAVAAIYFIKGKKEE